MKFELARSVTVPSAGIEAKDRSGRKLTRSLLVTAAFSILRKQVGSPKPSVVHLLENRTCPLIAAACPQMPDVFQLLLFFSLVPSTSATSIEGATRD